MYLFHNLLVKRRLWWFIHFSSHCISQRLRPIGSTHSARNCNKASDSRPAQPRCKSVLLCLCRGVALHSAGQGWPTRGTKPHAAHCPVSCSTYVYFQKSHWITCITINALQSSVIVMLAWDICNKFSWAKVCVWVRKRWVMFMCPHVYDVALCGNTIRNEVLGLWLVDLRCERSCSILASNVRFDYNLFEVKYGLT